MWEGDFIMFDEIPISTIKLPEGRFQTFLDISLSEELRWKSRRPWNKTFIRGASPGIPYELWDKNTIGWRRWNIATQERKVCDMEVEIVTFVVEGSLQLTVTLDRQELIQVGSRGVALCRVFELKLSGIHLTQIILKIWVIDWQYVIDVSVCEVELRCYFFLSSWEQRLYEFHFVWVQKYIG